MFELLLIAVCVALLISLSACLYLVYAVTAWRRIDKAWTHGQSGGGVI